MDGRQRHHAVKGEVRGDCRNDADENDLVVAFDEQTTSGCAGDQVYKTAKQIDPGLNVIVIRVTRTVRRWTGSYRSVPYGFKKPLKIEQLIQTVKILGRTTVMVEP